MNHFDHTHDTVSLLLYISLLIDASLVIILYYGLFLVLLLKTFFSHLWVGPKSRFIAFSERGLGLQV